MQDFRQSLLTLPFVTERRDGTLDYWSVATTGDRNTDMEIGRNYGARWLQFCREFGCPFLGPHLFEAWIESAPKCQGHIRDGFFGECVQALLLAPGDGTATMSLARSRRASVAPPVAPSGDWGEDTATGRFWGALTALEAREEEDGAALWRVAGEMPRSPRYRGIRVGWATEITEIQMAARGDCTPHQEAAITLHKAALRAA